MSTLSTIAGIVGTGINNHFAEERTNKQNMQNKELMHMQNAFNVAQVDKANAYNSPIMQMKRLKEAGINPALAFTNGVQGSSTPASASATPMMQQAPYMSPLSQLQDAFLKEQQLKNMEQERQLTGANTQATFKNIQLSDSMIMQINKNMQFTDSQMELIRKQGLQLDESTKKIMQEVENLRTANEGMKIDNAQKNLQLFFDNLTFDSKVEAEFARNGMSVLQFKLDMETYVEKVTNFKLQNSKLRAEVANIKQDTDLKKAQTNNTKWHSNLMSIDYENGQVQLRINKAKESVYGNKAVHWIDYGLEKAGQIIGMAGEVMSFGSPLGKVAKGFKVTNTSFGQNGKVISRSESVRENIY